MPRQAADLEEALNKKGGLTLSQLANYDDIITDALVDRVRIPIAKYSLERWIANIYLQVYFWSSIRKLKANYHACRGVQEELVCKILQQHVIIEKDPIKAHTELLKLPGIVKYCRSLKTDDEKEHFERHLRKYVNIYLPDCPFEVDTTNRYTVMTAEACIKARKTIKKGEAIKYLSGIQVEMTEREEKELSSRTDFSIVLSSRRKRPSLFLGPARFANHDCDSNARLNTTGPHGIHIVARKDIEPGDEITVTYGDDYFGIDNCECLCSTCEGLARNGWDPRGPLLHEDSSDDEEEDEEESKPVRPKRILKSESQSRSPSSLGKRKRIGEEIVVGQNQNAEAAERRARDGAKKHQRSDADDHGPTASRMTAQQRQGRNGESTQGSGRRVSDTESLDELAEARRNSRGRILPRAQDSATPARSERSSERQEWSPASRDGSPNTFLERIFNLLNSIGERKLQEEEELKSSTTTPKSSISPAPLASGGAQSDTTAGVPAGSNEKPSERMDAISNRSDSPLSSAQSSPTFARELSRSPSIERLSPQKRSSTRDRSKLGVPTAKLHAIKKERSTSALRNVINAEDEDAGVFSISPSPAPQQQSERSCDEPSKNQPAESPESTGSSSPSSHNDNFSATSQTSSMTSLESFAAGNIAFSICQMLTTEDEEEGQQTSLDTAEEINADDAMEVDESTPIESRPARGRQHQRKSVRKGAPAASTPPVQSIEKVERDESSEDEEKRGETRTPGDYTLCRALLSTPYHRWVECRNCDEFFVQGDAYLTRIACPRCERHSKLYGYYWPKTDKEGKFDKEERVLDHRTIHRFIDPDEERSEPKGRKTLAEVVKERELSSRQESEERDGFEKRLRNSPRRSESRRKTRMTM
jgi:histone-lysine N-methyltransferase SUV420H